MSLTATVYAVVRPEGDLDLTTVETLEQRLQEVADQGRTQRVVLDLRDLRFVDAYGLSALLRARGTLTDRLTLRSPSRRVRALVELLELDHELPFETAEAEI